MISKIPKWVLLGGGVLAFSAGMVNTIALLSFSHQGVTHVTGNLSRLSISVSEGEMALVYQMIFLLLSFLAGAILSGVIVHDAHLKLHQKYGWALGIECGLLLLSAYAFHRGSIAGEYIASMASGLQNALASMYSGAIIRTTHLTGVFTDLGVLIGHGLRGIKIDSRKVKLFFTLIAGFLSGGFFGVLFFKLWNTLAMLAPALVIGGSSIGYFFFQRMTKDESIRS